LENFTALVYVGWNEVDNYWEREKGMEKAAEKVFSSRLELKVQN
jgi:hypothetical protein